VRLHTNGSIIQRFLRVFVVPDKVVADADLIHGSTAEDVNLLNGKYTVTDSQFCAESRQAGGHPRSWILRAADERA